MRRLKRHNLIILVILISLLLTSCELYLPEKEIIYVTELNENDEYILKTNDVVIGDITVEKIKYGEFIPDEEKAVYVEGEVNTKLTDIYVRTGEHVKKDQLIAKADTEQIERAIFYQEINYQKALMSYEEGKTNFEKNLIDHYRLELLRLIYLSEENYLSDLNELLEKGYFYSPIEGEVVEVYKQVGDSGIGNIAKICKKEDGVVRISTEKEADEVAVNAGYAAPVIVSPVDYLFNRMENGTKFTIKALEKKYDGYLYRDIGSYMLLFGEEFTLNYMDIKFNKVPDEIYFGQSMTLIYTQASVENAIVISAASVHDDVDDKHYVYVVKNNRTVIREIETGLISEGYVQVVSGLEVGEKVLILR